MLVMTKNEMVLKDSVCVWLGVEVPLSNTDITTLKHDSMWEIKFNSNYIVFFGKKHMFFIVY